MWRLFPGEVDEVNAQKKVGLESQLGTGEKAG
jgi:hypothetical protein